MLYNTELYLLFRTRDSLYWLPLRFQRYRGTSDRRTESATWNEKKEELGKHRTKPLLLAGFNTFLSTHERKGIQLTLQTFGLKLFIRGPHYRERETRHAQATEKPNRKLSNSKMIHSNAFFPSKRNFRSLCSNDGTQTTTQWENEGTRQSLEAREPAPISCPISRIFEIPFFPSRNSLPKFIEEQIGKWGRARNWGPISVWRRLWRSISSLTSRLPSLARKKEGNLWGEKDKQKKLAIHSDRLSTSLWEPTHQNSAIVGGQLALTLSGGSKIRPLQTLVLLIPQIPPAKLLTDLDGQKVFSIHGRPEL